jgi:phosphatidate cytidylyltransferase
MSTSEKFRWLALGLLGVLTLSSLLGYLLSVRVQSAGTRATVVNLQARVRSWWVMVAILALAYLGGRGATIMLFAILSFMALREFVTLTPSRPGDHRALSVAFFVLVPVQYLLIYFRQYDIMAVLIPVYAFILLPAFSALAEDTVQFLERSAKLQWGVMISVFCISHAPALLLLDIPEHPGAGGLLLFFLLFVVQISDVLQYVFGKLLGKTPIAPVTSPSKTVEGFMYGGLAATVLGASLWWVTPFGPLAAAGFAAIIVLCGFLGGLVLSAVKRSLGAKDWGQLIEGHGGVLDRLDSVSFAAPVFFRLVKHFYT